MIDSVSAYLTNTEFDFAIRPSEELDHGHSSILFVMHDRGSNEQEALDTVAPLIGPLVTIVSIRGPVQIGANSFAFYDRREETVISGKSNVSHAQVLDLRPRLDKFINRPRPVRVEAAILGIGEGGTAVASLALYGGSAPHLFLSINGALWQATDQEMDEAWISHEVGGEQLAKTVAPYTHCFVAYGRQDPLYPRQCALDVCDAIDRVRRRLSFHAYSDMGRTPSEECFQDIRQWLRQCSRGMIYKGAVVGTEESDSRDPEE